MFEEFWIEVRGGKILHGVSDLFAFASAVFGAEFVLGEVVGGLVQLTGHDGWCSEQSRSLGQRNNDFWATSLAP